MSIKYLISIIAFIMLSLNIHQGVTAEKTEEAPLLLGHRKSPGSYDVAPMPTEVLSPELQKQNLIKWSQNPLSSSQQHLTVLRDPNTLTYARLLEIVGEVALTNNDDKKMIDCLDEYLLNDLERGGSSLGRSLLETKARKDTAVVLLSDMNKITDMIKGNIEKIQNFVMQEGVVQEKAVNYDWFSTPYLTYHYDIDDPSTVNALNRTMCFTCCLDQLCCCLIDNLLCLQSCCHPMSVTIRGNVNEEINSLINNAFQKVDKKMEVYHFLTNDHLEIKGYDQLKKNFLQHGNCYNSDDSCCWYIVNSGF